MARAPRSLALVSGPIAGYNEFEMDVEIVLREQLPAFFESIDQAALTRDNVNQLPQGAKGAYLLFHNHMPVYAGKTDSRHGFRDRLGVASRGWWKFEGGVIS